MSTRQNKVRMIILKYLVLFIAIGASNYLSIKASNLATKQDIRIISSEESKGKLDIVAAEDVMEILAKTDVEIEKLILDMSLEAIEKKNSYSGRAYIHKLYNTFSILVQTLNKNKLLLPMSAQHEIDFFRNQWANFLGKYEYKWAGSSLSTVLVKWAAIRVFIRRMSRYLDQKINKKDGRDIVFKSEEAEKEYDVYNILNNMISKELEPYVFLSLKTYSVDENNLKEMFPNIKYKEVTPKEGWQ